MRKIVLLLLGVLAIGAAYRRMQAEQAEADLWAEATTPLEPRLDDRDHSGRRGDQAADVLPANSTRSGG